MSTLDELKRIIARIAHCSPAEINLETTPHSHLMDFSLLGKAGEIVPKLMEGWE